MNSRILFTLLITGALTPGLFSGENRHCTLKILNNSRKTVIINAEIAETEGAQRRGLMFRRILSNNYGMLFIFNSERPLRFWMKNTYIPLSIAYISKKGVINEIYQMKPLDISVTYPSKIPAKYALEVKQGWFARKGIKPGSKIIFNGCIGK